MMYIESGENFHLLRGETKFEPKKKKKLGHNLIFFSLCVARLPYRQMQKHFCYKFVVQEEILNKLNFTKLTVDFKLIELL